MHDLADEHPDTLQALIALWFYEAGRFNGLPIESRNAVEVLTTPRPEIGKPRDHYIYYAGCAEVPEAAAVNIRNRSYTVAAEVDVHDADAHGVIPPTAPASVAMRSTSRTTRSATCTTSAASWSSR